MANTLSTRIDQDVLNMLSRDLVAQKTQLLLDPLRNERGEVLLAATATAFVVMAERFGRSPQDLYQYGQRVLHADEAFHKKGNAQLEALRDFAALRVHQNPTI